MVTNSDPRDSNSHFLPPDIPQLLQALDRELVALHQERSLDQVQQLARLVQAVATEAEQASLDPIPAIAQRLYQILAALLQQSIPVDSALERLLQQACDAIRLPLTEQIVLGQFDATDVLSGTEPILAQLEARLEAEPQSFVAEADDLFSFADLDAIEPDFALSELNHDAPDNEAWALEPLFAPTAEDEDLAFDPFLSDESEALDLFEADPAEPSDGVHVELDEPLAGSTEEALDSFFADEEHTLGIDEVGSAGVEPSAHEEEPLLADLDPAIVADLSPATAEEFLSLDSLFAEEPSPNGTVSPSAPVASAPDRVLSSPLAPVPREIASPAEPDEDTLLLQAIFGEPAIEAPNFTDVEGEGDRLFSSTAAERQAEPIAHIMPPQGGVSEVSQIDLPGEALSQPDFLQEPVSLEVPTGESLTAEPSDIPSWNRDWVSLSRDRLEGLYDLLDVLLLHQNQLTQHNSQMQAAAHALESQAVEPQNGAKRTVQPELEQLEQLAEQSQQTLQEHRHVLGDVRRRLLEAQTLSLKTFLERFAPIVYRFAPDQAPQLQLQVTPLWLDRALLEALDEPIQSLLHCVVTHRLQSPLASQLLGAVGPIELRSHLQGTDLVIEIHAEEGSGLSPEILHRRALELGWISADSPMASALDGVAFTVTPELFSWREIAPSDPSYALAKSAAYLRSLGGWLTVQAARDRGITLRLQIPTALVVMQLLICLVQQTPVAFPAAQLQEIILAPVGPTSSDRASTVVWQGQAIPIYRLDDHVSDLPAQPHAESSLPATKFPAHWPAPVLIVAGAHPVAFEVGALVNQQEVMVRPPKPAIAAPAYLHGHAMLENGIVIPVIDGWILAEMLKTGADQR